jgi:hypothetical protein
MGKSNIIAVGALIILYLGFSGNAIGYEQNDTAILDEIAMSTWNYLHSPWSTANHMPFSWKSDTSEGSYANTAEIGLYALCWIAAYEMQRPWSPSWEETEENITAILDQLLTWQNNPPYDYDDRGAFYQWYWVKGDDIDPTPRRGGGIGDDEVPSIDNAWLAVSLITLRQYAIENNHTDLSNKSSQLIDGLNFSIWYHQETHQFTMLIKDDPQKGVLCDYYSGENRIVNLIAMALGQISEDEFHESLKNLLEPTLCYNEICVEKTNWNGAYFTYTTPALFIPEMSTSYGTNTIIPATKAQIEYARNEGYAAWGLSDCNDPLNDRYIMNQGAPPKGMGNGQEPAVGYVAPYASALALITPLQKEAIANLRVIKEEAGPAYNDSFGFQEWVNASNESFGETSQCYTALSQEWILLSISNVEVGFPWRYFYNDEGVKTAVREMYGELSISDL